MKATRDLYIQLLDKVKSEKDSILQHFSKGGSIADLARKYETAPFTMRDLLRHAGIVIPKQVTQDTYKDAIHSLLKCVSFLAQNCSNLTSKDAEDVKKELSKFSHLIP